MRKKLWLLLFLVVQQSIAASSAIQQANNQATVNMGYLPTQINKSPISNNSQYFKGHQLNLETIFTKTFYDHLYTQLSLDGMAGNLSYGKRTPLSPATTFLQQYKLRFGYSYFPTETIGFTPYLAAGYQVWQLDGGGIPGHVGIKDGETKIYQNGIVGFGLLTQATLSPKLVASMDLQAGRTINPWMRFNASTVPNSMIGTSVIYQQSHLLPQWYYQAGVGIDYRVTPSIHTNVGIQYNHTEASSAVTRPSNLREPHLSVAMWNYHVGVGYSFLSPEELQALAATHNYLNDDIYRANNQAAFWFGYLLRGYAETVPGQQYYFDREAGNFPIVNMSLAKTYQRIYGQFNLSSGGGNTAYKSTAGNTSAPSNDKTRNTTYDVGLRLGYILPANDNSSFTPYIAGGFHRLMRDINGVPDEGFLTSGYTETYQNAWYAIGTLFQFVPQNHWVMTLDGNVGTTQNAANRTWFPDNVGTHTNQQVWPLKQRFLFNLGVGSDYRFMQTWHALVQINYLYLKYGKSASTALGDYEPNSTTKHLTMTIGIGCDI